MKIIYSFLFTVCCNKSNSRTYILLFSCKFSTYWLFSDILVLLHSQNSMTYYLNVNVNLVQFFFLCYKVVKKMFCNQVRLNNSRIEEETQCRIILKILGYILAFTNKAVVQRNLIQLAFFIVFELGGKSKRRKISPD